MAYKSNLAQKNKKIKTLQEELQRCKDGGEQIRWIIEHNLLDLAGELAKHNKELLEFATSLKMMAQELEERAKDADFFLHNIIKHLPKAKNVAKIARK